MIVQSQMQGDTKILLRSAITKYVHFCFLGVSWRFGVEVIKNSATLWNICKIWNQILDIFNKIDAFLFLWITITPDLNPSGPMSCTKKCPALNFENCATKGDVKLICMGDKVKKLKINPFLRYCFLWLMVVWFKWLISGYDI